MKNEKESHLLPLSAHYHSLRTAVCSIQKAKIFSSSIQDGKIGVLSGERI